ncbi:SDR family oxidoreductase [Mucilaginibacter rubeus]|uniref:SDR family oxidoreductase n=1 Tax=Mucilaginibacter rubeus TaxID=2027860 RepID=A0AAE6JE72_9SPHI|nr:MULTISPECIES: SDR family oxidoreductase [Mucilaginibacter]QEM03911.1 SDR family oxidoreductase [Mucilaginibacter rubeus]QEM16521.1 SDR family oxidoreductase [Mucilaginibacter gossypii]QTE40711.1 SDR family oxidoreductase [Mucilaginibacter rubeus]QTE47313.1 SDR family oxidoreductase [Mucilaginibacter rubeus]QTE58706.1 SDR family oxidoreductase [Mucilaginibacter rubeus]
MDLKLNDKIALVTGSTAGIGYAIAKSLANEGATVYVNGRSQTKVDEVVKKLIAETGNNKIKGIAADFSNIAQVETLTAQLPEVDILVNNVGIFEPKPFTEITDADWLKFFEVNVLSGVRLSRAYFDKMISKNWGRIIFISSESAYQIPEEMIHYGTTKTAQIAVARGLAELTKSTGVTVNTVLPGPTLSEGVGDFIEALAKDQGLSNTEVEKEFFTNVRGTSLIKRFITTEEIANMVTYIASPLSAATNGATLRADGGVIKTAF